MEKLRLIAGARLRADWLERWWCKKFRKPRKDPLLQEYTLEELMIEFLEDVIEAKPSEEYVTRDGQGVVFKTGDEWFDKLNEKIAEGGNVTLEDLGVSARDRAKLKAQAAAAEPPQSAAVTPPPASSTSSPDTQEVEPTEDIEESYG